MVRLTALNSRITPMVGAEVVYLSADALPDEKKNSQVSDVYVVRVELNSEEAAKVPGFTPTPGMPAEVYIKTVERTFLDYLLQPIRDSMARAFRELLTPWIADWTLSRTSHPTSMTLETREPTTGRCVSLPKWLPQCGSWRAAFA